MGAKISKRNFRFQLYDKYDSHGEYLPKINKRSKDLGALLDSCSRDDIGNFLQSADLYQKLTAAD